MKKILHQHYHTISSWEKYKCCLNEIVYKGIYDFSWYQRNKFCQKEKRLKPKQPNESLSEEHSRRQCVSKLAKIFDLTGKIKPITATMKIDLHTLADLPSLTVFPWDSRFWLWFHGLTVIDHFLTVNSKVYLVQKTVFFKKAEVTCLTVMLKLSTDCAKIQLPRRLKKKPDKSNKGKPRFFNKGGHRLQKQIFSILVIVIYHPL